MNWHWTSIDKLSEVSRGEFDTLHDPNAQSCPFLQYAFLHAFEQTKCVGEQSGWLPSHIVVRDEENKLIAFLPAYIKTHSYGEYVFDHSWANAYEQHGLAYYPKLIIALPFTPVTAARALIAASTNIAKVTQYIGDIKESMMQKLSISSIHILFPDEQSASELLNHGFHQRMSVQFNWHNKQYSHFDDFMASLTARRRRSIKKERKGITKQGVSVRRVAGDNISQQDIDFFYTCYQQTYLKRSGHTGYLNHEFFNALLSNMPQNMMLVIAQKEIDTPVNTDIGINETSNNRVDTTKNHDKSCPPIAAALFLFDNNGLYGRYWGALEEVSGLHFEACYYQGIEFCIEQNITLFNPGTQGEHKILRGFEPTLCYSNHKMLEPAFDSAVSDFLTREAQHIIDYSVKSASLLPYKDTNNDD